MRPWSLFISFVPGYNLIFCHQVLPYQSLIIRPSVHGLWARIVPFSIRFISELILHTIGHVVISGDFSLCLEGVSLSSSEERGSVLNRTAPRQRVDPWKIPVEESFPSLQCVGPRQHGHMLWRKDGHPGVMKPPVWHCCGKPSLGWKIIDMKKGL